MGDVPTKVWIVMGFIGLIIVAMTLLAIHLAYTKKWDKDK